MPSLPAWCKWLADIEDLPECLVKTYLQENDITKVVDFEDEEYKELKFVRVYQIYQGVTSVLEIEINAARMYLEGDWDEDESCIGSLVNALNF